MQGIRRRGVRHLYRTVRVRRAAEVCLGVVGINCKGGHGVEWLVWFSAGFHLGQPIQAGGGVGA
eukprot:5151619-Lingulodinium_polyedra.AAC.1